MAALAARSDMSPREPAPDLFRVATWNVNSLRARTPALARFLERARPDVVCLQETKAAAPAPEAARVFEREGYNLAYAGDGPYNGVAIASLHPIGEEHASGGLGDEHLDREPRLITVVVDSTPPIRVVSLYAPHGREVGHWHYEYKLAFFAQLERRVVEWLENGHVILAGDVNIAPTDSDIFHPDAFVGLTHVTPLEREAWARVLDAGLVDVDAALWGPHKRRFTWWNHGISYSRNLGMRLDMITADAALARCVKTTWIDHVERGADRPSDHAALLADFDLAKLTSNAG